MTLLLDATLKGTLIVGAAFVVLWLLRARSASLRHCVLAAALAVAALVPLIESLLPPLDVGLQMPAVSQPRPVAAAARRGELAPPPMTPTSTAAPSEAVIGERRTPAEPVSVAGIATGIWLAGTSLMLLALVTGFSRLRWLTKAATRIERGAWADAAGLLATEYGIRRRVALLQTSHPSLLVTWGWIRPRIALPAGAAAWPADRIRIVLAHELAHVRRGDWIVQLAAEAIRAACWFNPIVWIACRRLRDESERACDDAVLARGVEAPEYAWQLLQLAHAFRRPPASWFPAPAIARPSMLEQRIGAMLDPRVNREPVTARAAVRVAALLVLLAAPIAAAQAGPGSFSGTVFNPGGGPAANARIVLSRGVGEPAYEQVTDADGRFAFTDVPAATYRLDVWGGDDAGRRRVRWGDLAWALLGESVTVRGGVRVARDLTLPLGTIAMSTGVTVNRAGVQVRPRDRGFPPTWQCLSGLLMNGFCGPPSLLEEFERDFQQDGTLPPDVKMPRLVESGVPEYPAALVGLGVEGDVTLEGRIGTHGFIDDLRLLGVSNSALVESALAAARRMRWEPARIQDVPTEMPIRLDVEFRIQQ